MVLTKKEIKMLAKKYQKIIKNRQGVLKLELNGYETSELRRLVAEELNKRLTKLNRTYLIRLQYKLNGSYQCQHCKQWVIKGGAYGKS